MIHAATRRLGWAVTLTLAATVAIFVLEPLAGRISPDAGPATEPAGPWYARYGRWLGTLAQFEFERRTLEPFERGGPEILLAVVVTMMVAVAALLLTSFLATIVLVIAGRRAHLCRVSALAAVLTVATPLAWLAGTLVVAIGWLNDAAGATVLPTAIGNPLVERLSRTDVTAEPSAGSPWSFLLTYVHQAVFPAALLAVVLAPAVALWVYPILSRQVNADAPRDEMWTVAAVTVLIRTSRLLPLFVAGVIVVELTSGSFGAGDLLFDWMGDKYVFAVATGTLLLGLYLSMIRMPLEVWIVWVTQRSATRPPRPPPPERVNEFFLRLRSDPLARLGALVMTVVVLVACYSRLWFAVGPHDVVSTGGPRPPSVDHWLGIDPLGRDQLVRVATAVGGSLFVAAVAATVATLVGLTWVMISTRLPERASRPVRTSADLLLAVPAAVWIALPGGLPGRTFASAGQRLTLAVAIGALAVPIAIRLLWRCCEATLRNENSPIRPVGPLAGTWLAVLACALLAEHIATFLLFMLNERSPTLGALLARTVAETRLLLPPPMTIWPWLWYPPAIATTLLVAGSALLAMAVLRVVCPR